MDYSADNLVCTTMLWHPIVLQQYYLPNKWRSHSTSQHLRYATCTSCDFSILLCLLPQTPRKEILEVCIDCSFRNLYFVYAQPDCICRFCSHTCNAILYLEKWYALPLVHVGVLCLTGYNATDDHLPLGILLLGQSDR